MSSLQGETALVTGASKNIGRAIAKRLADAGCCLTLAAHTGHDGLKTTAEVARERNVDVHTFLTDLSSEAGCKELLSQVLKAMGRVDILIHTVAVRPHQSLETLKFC